MFTTRSEVSGSIVTVLNITIYMFTTLLTRSGARRVPGTQLSSIHAFYIKYRSLRWERVVGSFPVEGRVKK